MNEGSGAHFVLKEGTQGAGGADILQQHLAMSETINDAVLHC